MREDGGVGYRLSPLPESYPVIRVFEKWMKDTYPMVLPKSKIGQSIEYASAYRAAIVYSLIGTCKNAGIEPRVWMEDVLKQIPYYLREDRDLAELLPRAWALRNQLRQNCCE